jgi:SAM-dependent methyltransferase
MDRPVTPREVIAHYERGLESGRLAEGEGLLELERTQSVLGRVLPPAPARILDVGGGPGAYAAWLARGGYEVALVDPVRLHVAQAAARSAEQPEHGLAAQPGDARSLAFPDESVDAVLLLGPLYHLVERRSGPVEIAARCRSGHGSGAFAPRREFAHPGRRSPSDRLRSPAGRDLACWDVESRAWRIEPGRFEIEVGHSSRDIRLHQAFDLA